VRRLLLDTHALLWWLGDATELGEQARGAIMRADAAFVSAASAWEIAIKRALGKLTVPEGLSAVVLEEGFLELPITLAHSERAGGLPAHHRDPFDRMLIAQAQAEELVLVTADCRINRYDVQTLAAGV